MKNWPLLIGLILFCPICSAEWQSVLGYQSNYFHRGLQYQDNTELIYASSQFQFVNGFYLGLWLSEKQKQEPDFRGRRELDYIIGYTFTNTSPIVLDIAFARYTFPESIYIDYDWQELSLALHIEQNWTLALGYNQNQLMVDSDGNFVELTFRYAPELLPRGSLIDISAGSVNNDVLNHRYYYYEIGASKSFGHWRPRLSWTDTNSQQQLPFSPQLTDGNWMMSISYSF